MTSDRFITNRNQDGDIIISVNGTTEVMRIDGYTGRVGIGTASPTSKLHVIGDAYLSSNVKIATTSNQLVLGTTNTVTLSASAPSASRIYTLPDVAADAYFVMTAGNQTIAGTKTFSGNALLDGTGNLIKGRTDGASIAAGYVGQVLVADQGAGAFSTSTTGAWVDVSLLQLSLTAGVWLITASGSVYQSSLTNTGSSACIVDVRIMNGATEVASNYSASSFLIGGILGVVRDIRQQDSAFAMTAIINNSDSRTVKVQVQHSISGTASTPTCGVRQYSKLYAIRIA